MMKILLIALIFCLVAVTSAENLRSTLAVRNAIPFGWNKLNRAQQDSKIPFTINLKQRNLDKLEKIFWDVSNPDSVNYKNYLTLEQIDEIVAPPHRVVKKIKSFLNGAVSSSEVKGDHIKVVATVSQLEKLFQTEFFTFQNKNSAKTIIRHTSSLTLPKDIADHIDFVSGLSEFFDNTKIYPKSYGPSNKVDAANPIVNPAFIKNFYNQSSTLRASNQNSSQSIAAFDDYFSAGALAQFDKSNNLPSANIVKILGTDCLGQGCDEYESDLDTQYITSTGFGINTWFWEQAGGAWVLEWAQSVNGMSQVPWVHSVSYGWAELAQCDVTSYCSKLGYTSQQYVQRTDTEFQKFGVRGVTVLVSSGDDGAVNLGGSVGNWPIDGSTTGYCPVGGCTHTSTQCGGIIITKSSNVCIFPQGQGSDACSTLLQESTFQTAFEKFISGNSHCKVAVDQDQGSYDHIYSSCQCSALKPVTYSGFTIAPYIYNTNNGIGLAPDYPTSSPYVTSVGATQVLGNGPQYTEAVASILNKALITGGGGFNVYASTPSYQSSFVSSYLSSGTPLPPSTAFNAQGRGYPDITLNGHNYEIYYSNNGQKCPCQATQVDGTSCSSPTSAGMYALINDALFNQGKKSLGFLNPLLYKAAAAQPNVFNDITTGNNFCNRAYCGQWGFTAVQGWDPASGLGSTNFGNMKAYILANSQV